MDINTALKIVLESNYVICDGSIEVYYYPDDKHYVITSYDDRTKGYVSEQHDKVEDAINSYLRHTNERNTHS
jgi:hypothetical protein